MEFFFLVFMNYVAEANALAEKKDPSISLDSAKPTKCAIIKVILRKLALNWAICNN